MSKYDNRAMNDVYLLFKNDNELQDYLLTKTKPIAKFKACDEVSEHSGSVENNGYRAENIRYLTIRTNAFINVERNDIIYNVKTKDKWRVIDWTVDDDGEEKKYKLRPHKQTIIQLQR